MSQNRGNKAHYGVSICPSGHATLLLGRSALFLEVEELRWLVESAQEALAQHERRGERFDEAFATHLAH